MKSDSFISLLGKRMSREVHDMMMGVFSKMGMIGGAQSPASQAMRQAANQMRGAGGEMAVAIVAKACGVPAIHDLYLPKGEGATQIDHILFLGDLLLVVETKNWSGLIFGGAEDQSWTIAGRGGRKSRYQNPLIQNLGHVAATNAFIETKIPTKGAVVMLGECDFPKGCPPNVIGLRRLTNYMQQRKRLTDPSPDNVRVWNSLHEFQRNCDLADLKRRHQEAVEKAKARRS